MCRKCARLMAAISFVQLCGDETIAHYSHVCCQQILYRYKCVYRHKHFTFATLCFPSSYSLYVILICCVILTPINQLGFILWRYKAMYLYINRHYEHSVHIFKEFVCFDHHQVKNNKRNQRRSSNITFVFDSFAIATWLQESKPSTKTKTTKIKMETKERKHNAFSVFFVSACHGANPGRFYCFRIYVFAQKRSKID